MSLSKSVKLVTSIILLVLGFVYSVNSLATDAIDPDTDDHELVVVVHLSTPTLSLSKKQLIDIYMGRFKTFPNGDPVTPIDFKSGTDLKQRFYELLVGKSERKINAYWSRLLFSGRATPPHQADSITEIQKLITEDKNSLAYLQASDVTQEMKIVYQFDKD